MSLLPPIETESELSYAYLHAVAAKAGMSCEVSGRHADKMGVDATIRAVEQFANDLLFTDLALDVQLKATVQKQTLKDGKISYFLKGVGRYNKLRKETVTPPRIMVVLFLPTDRKEWLKWSKDELAMRDRELARQFGSRIPPTAVRDYAKTRGWEPAAESKRRLWIFSHPEAGLRQLIIPIDRDDAWPDAVFEIVLRLAELEHRTPETVLNNLVAANSDIVRFRIGGEDVSGGMLPMDDATGLIEGARRALLSSACSVINRVTHHPRMSRTEATEFLRVCKMGQTEIGSYVVKVVCPLTEMEEPPILQAENPFAREATTVLMRSCQKIVESIEQDHVEEMLEVNEMVTSNLCDALLRMHSARDNADLTIETSWAALPKYKIADIPSVAAFKPEYFHTVEEIQRHLRPRGEQEQALFLLGTVETLNGDVGEDGRRLGEVVFALLLPEEEVVRARGNLNAADYEKAVNAHEAGRGYVSFNGVLKRGDRVGRVDEITEFRKLDSSNVHLP